MPPATLGLEPGTGALTIDELRDKFPLLEPFFVLTLVPDPVRECVGTGVTSTETVAGVIVGVGVGVGVDEPPRSGFEDVDVSLFCCSLVSPSLSVTAPRSTTTAGLAPALSGAEDEAGTLALLPCPRAFFSLLIPLGGGDPDLGPGAETEEETGDAGRVPNIDDTG